MKEELFSHKAIAFNKKLLTIQKQIISKLPAGYQLMNPFLKGQALAISSDFYRLFYQDHYQRKIILGINPGRHGAGQTGVPFTDSKKLQQLNINTRNIQSFEPSAVFIYQVIAQFGGAKKFYQKFYFNSPLPLGLLQKNKKGNLVNANYYDNKKIQESVKPMIDYAMQEYHKMSLDKKIAYCLGQGKNYQFLEKYNKQHHLFEKIIPLAHPRYIMQYKFSQMADYQKDYLEKLTKP